MYVSAYLSLKVWGFAVVQDETRLVTGCSDSELRVWKISYTENDTSESTEDIKKQNSKRSAEEAGLHDEAQEDAAEVSSNYLLYQGCSEAFSICKLWWSTLRGDTVYGTISAP